MAKSGANSKMYKLHMQKVGISLPNPHNSGSVPSTANPITKLDPGLGAKTITHPFKAGKQSI